MRNRILKQPHSIALLVVIAGASVFALMIKNAATMSKISPMQPRPLRLNQVVVVVDVSSPFQRTARRCTQR